MAIADEDPRRHGREAIPGGEESAGLVEEGGDEPTVDDPRPALVSLLEVDVGLVELPALDLRRRQPEPEGRLPAAPAGRVVVRRDVERAHRRPPRSRWAR